MKVIDIQHVSKSFGAFLAVDDISLSLKDGDHLAIVGESGSGKTTLAKMMMGLIRPDAGSIGVEAFSLQMVFQDPNQSLDPLWNIREILKEALVRQPSLSAQQTQARLEQMLKAVGLLPDVLSRFPHEFSGGERQRIAIARALLARPRVLLLDEAVSALDTLVQKQIIDLLNRLKHEFQLTTIFISHNLRLVRQFSDKIIVMQKGRVVEEGQVQTVLKSPAHPYTQELVRAAFFSRDKV